MDYYSPVHFVHPAGYLRVVFNPIPIFHLAPIRHATDQACSQIFITREFTQGGGFYQVLLHHTTVISAKHDVSTHVNSNNNTSLEMEW